ncbi:MAG TPA: pitrilysin family protein [Candidatus Saccharimonadales bacterium]|nr:pitrilysin family protein [Candidatus Saccharimonadales bacterium]
MKHTVDKVELKNGAKGLLIDVPGATVTSYELNFRAGEFLVPKRKWEVPHLMEHIVAAGANEYYPDRQIYQSELSKNGADSNAYTSYYSVSYVGEVADFEWDRVLGLLFKGLTKPLFLKQEFDAESGNIRDELTSYTNNHFRELASELSRSFGFNVATDRQRIDLMKNIEREDLIEHYKKTHFASNIRFVIAGSLRGRRSEVKKIIEEIELPKGPGRIKLPLEKARKPQKPVFVANETVPNIYLIISTHLNDIISTRDDDALGLARIMLTETLYSKIFGQARDRGLVYHVSSGHHLSNRVTEWFLSAQVLAENAQALSDIVMSEVKKIQNGIIDDKELEGAKQYALGSFQRSLQTVNSVASAYGRYFFDGYVEDMRTIPARIKAVTKSDMARAMRQMFSEDLGSVGILGGTDSTLSQKLYDQLQPLWR